jgi:hypothetical protein
MTWAHLIVADASGELLFADRRVARETLEAGGQIIKPRPAEKAWRERAMAAAIKARREPQHAMAVDGLAKVLLGTDWLAEAMRAYGNPVPDAVLMAAINEDVDARWQAYQSEVSHDALPAMVMSINRGENMPAYQREARLTNFILTHGSALLLRERIAKTITDSLRSAGYDVNKARVTEVANHQAEALAERVKVDVNEARTRIDALVKAKQSEADAEREAEREAAAERVEALSDSLPEGLSAFFSGHGIEVKLNAAETTWQPKGGGRRKPRAPATTSQPGERFMLFDPKGRGGHLANILAGNKALQSRYNATWTIFDDNLWWHMPADGLDYDALMEAFE